MKILPLVLVAALAAAESTPTPTVPAATEAATTGSARPGRGVRVATVGEMPPVWDARAMLSGGYDSNAILSSNPDDVTSGTATYSGEVGLGWRPVMERDRYLRLGFVAAYDRRPGIEDLDTGRLGFQAVGARQAGSLVQGASLGLTRYTLDNAGAAAEARVGLSLAKVRTDQIDIGSLEISAVHYDETGHQPDFASAWTNLGTADDRSGVLVAGGWRHWWNRPDRSRYEVALRLGRNWAQVASETYTTIQPQAGVRLHPGDGIWDLQARLGLELRGYDGTRAGESGAEQQATANLSLSADRRIGSSLWAGAVAGLADRASSAIDRDYERWQAALRLTYLISAEEL